MGELIYDTTDGKLQHCTGTGGAGAATWEDVAAGASSDFEAIYGNDLDNTLSTTNGDFTVDTGTGDFSITSNDWSIDPNGNITGNNIVANGTLDANGVVTIGDNGDNVTIDSSVWDISSAGVASGFTGITSSGNINFTGTTTLGSGGTGITKHISTTVSNVATGSIPAKNCDDYASVTVTGVAVGDTVIASPTATAGGIETVALIWNEMVSAADTVLIRACNPLASSPIDTDDTQTWRFDIWKH